ncbi:hypothetical protein BH11PLA2_BH11PLA2_48570 [soil metagenome]
MNLTEVWLAAYLGQAIEADQASDAALARVGGPGQELNWLCVEIDRAECSIFLNDQEGAAAVLDRIAGHPSLTIPYCRSGYDALAYRLGRNVVPPKSLPPDQPTNRIWLLSILADRANEVEDWAELERLSQARLMEVKRLTSLLANPEDRAALDPLRESIRNALHRAITRQSRDPVAESKLVVIQPLDPAVAARQWRQFSLAILMVELVSIPAAVFIADEFRHGPQPRFWIAATLVVYAGIAAFFVFWAGLIIAVYGMMRWKDRRRIANYGTRSMIWALFAFGTPMMILIGSSIMRLTSQ